MKRYYCGTFIISILFCLIHAAQIIPEHEIGVIGLQIWRNEDSRRRLDLVSWNKNEEGPCLGIGHFTWYPKNSRRKSTGTFPELVAFLQQEGKPLPKEFGEVDLATFYAPWLNREDFLAHQYDPNANALRKYLLNTIALQMRFIVQRLEKSMPILKHFAATPEVKDHIEKQFFRLAATACGRYALVDYTNLSGEAGLLRVLKKLQGSDENSAVQEFVTAAKSIMAARVATPKGSNQARWLKGWHNRLQTYLTFDIK